MTWAIARLRPQVDEILINANQNLEIYRAFGYRVVPDEIGGFAGPLAGLHAGLKAATHALVVTVPCDSPFLPADLVSRLNSCLKGNDLAVARTGDQPHPVFALMKREVRESLEAFLASGGRKIDAWYAALKVVDQELVNRAQSIAACPDPDLSLTREGEIVWRSAVVGQLAAGPAPLKPRVLLKADAQLTGPDRDAAQARLEKFIER